MMSAKMQNTLNQLKVLALCGGLVIVVTMANYGRALLFASDRSAVAPVHLGKTILGMLIVIAVSLLSLKIKELIPLKIPAFAWCSLVSLFLTIPASPIAGLVKDLTASIGLGVIGTCILAIAGVVMGMHLNELKKLSWKIIIISIVVFCGTYFGSAVVAHLLLKATGQI